MSILLFFAGLALLILGAELLVRCSSKLAASLGVPSLIIGLTVVAIGTSAPELAVSLKSILAGQPSIAAGNVIGSNTFNVLFILGLSALISPLTVSRQLIRLDVPVMITASGLTLVFSLDGRIGRVDGSVLILALILYTAFLLHHSHRQAREGKVQDIAARKKSGSNLINVILVVAGLFLLLVGSRWLVGSAVAMAETLGVSQLVIGLTIVAGGTSLPEVVTSVVASVRGERDIAVGNVVGSNVFNLLGVLGFSGLIAPQAVPLPPSVIAFDLPVMLVASFACMPVFFTGGVISRWEGGFLFAYYWAYIVYLVLLATRNHARSVFEGAMLYFVIPLMSFSARIPRNFRLAFPTPCFLFLDSALETYLTT